MLSRCQVHTTYRYKKRASFDAHAIILIHVLRHGIGWDDMSWGYHGDDGHAFSCSGTGRSYGPTFTTGDTIGCILNLADLSAGYTKNGLFLGLAFKNLSKDIKDSKARDRGLTLFPMIGLRTPGEVVQANFGQRPFKFDIENYYRVCVLFHVLWAGIEYIAH